MNQSTQSTTNIDLSIVIPTWNEERRLPVTLAKIRRFQDEFEGRIEVLLRMMVLMTRRQKWSVTETLV